MFARFLTALCLGLVLFVATGCDDAEALLDDAERIVGTWELTGISDSNGDRSILLGGFDEVSVGFTSDLVYDFFVDFAPIGGLDGEQRYGGNYTVVPATGFVTLTVDLDGTPAPIPFEYDFDGDDTLKLAADSDTIAPLFALGGTPLPLEGRVTLTFTD